jgi:hypothetical protein
MVLLRDTALPSINAFIISPRDTKNVKMLIQTICTYDFEDKVFLIQRKKIKDGNSQKNCLIIISESYKECS